MKKWPLDELWVVAAWEPVPPNAPWRSIVPVFAPVDNPAGLVVWPTVVDVQGGFVFGYEEPWAGLEMAIQEARATAIGGRLRAHKGHELVRKQDGGYAVVHRDEIARDCRAEIRVRLDHALRALDEGGPLETIQDAFDEAYLVRRFDPVATTLRAGAAARLRGEDKDWYSQCVDDFAYAVELGVDRRAVRDLEAWRSLAHAPLREELYRQAAEALDDRLRPTTELAPPVDLETRAAAVATALWRRRYAKASRIALSHEVLTRVLAGDPEGFRAARPALEATPDWARLMAETRQRVGVRGPNAPLDGDMMAAWAHAQIADLERFTRSLYHLEMQTEQVAEGPARSAAWRAFLLRTGGLSQQRDPRPWRQGELAAEALRNRLDLDGRSIASMSSLAATSGIFVGVASLSGGGVDGAASEPRNVPPCMFVDEAIVGDPGLRSRFAMAHQLCHLLMDRGRTGNNVWACRTTALRHEDGALVLDEEERANAFAAYLLAPRDAVRQLSPILPATGSEQFVELVLKMRAHFGLTATAAAEHLLNCHRGLEAPEPGRDELPSPLRQRIEGLASKGSVSGFEADQEPDAAPEGPTAASRLRRGRFARLVRRCLVVGDLSVERAAELIGGDPQAIARWLLPPGDPAAQTPAPGVWNRPWTDRKLSDSFSFTPRDLRRRRRGPDDAPPSHP